MEAILWAKAKGRSSFWAPASWTEKDGISAGTAILARNYLQASVPETLTSPQGVFANHRGVATVINAGGLGPILVVSCYFCISSCAKVAITRAIVNLLPK